jgi:hypothetical protein
VFPIEIDDCLRGPLWCSGPNVVGPSFFTSLCDERIGYELLMRASSVLRPVCSEVFHPTSLLMAFEHFLGNIPLGFGLLGYGFGRLLLWEGAGQEVVIQT